MLCVFACLDPRVVAMLAEIFMVRLEAAVRPVQENFPPAFLRSYLSALVPNSRSSGTKMGLLKVSARSVRAKVSVVDRRQGWLQAEMLCGAATAARSTVDLNPPAFEVA